MSTILSDNLIKFKNDYLAVSKKDQVNAAKSRDYFLTELKGKVKAKKDGPQLYSEAFINFGSRYDGTQYGELDEMDMLVVIDSKGGNFSSNGNVIGEGQGKESPNHKYDKNFMKGDGSGISGSKLVNWLKDIATEIIDEGYSASAEPKKDGQAITVKVESLGLSFDLVVAGVFEHKLGRGTFYNISNGAKCDGWILTNPKVDKEKMLEHGATYDNFADVIRVLKFIRDHYKLDLSSHMLKCVTVDYVEKFNYWRNDFGADLKSVLGHLKSSLQNKHIPNLMESYLNGEKENLLDRNKNYDEVTSVITKVIDEINKLDSLAQDKVFSKLVSIFSNNEITTTDEKKSSAVNKTILGDDFFNFLNG